MIKKAEIVLTGTAQRNDKGDWDIRNWAFGVYPLEPQFDMMRGMLCGWPFEFLREIYQLLGEGISLQECFFCGAPTVPPEINWDVFTGDLFTKFWEITPIRLAEKIGKRVICVNCYKELGPLMLRLSKGDHPEE